MLLKFYSHTINNNKYGKKTISVILSLFLFCLGIVNLFPFVFMLSSSFKFLNNVFEYPIKIIPDPFTFNNYIGLFSAQYDFIRWYLNTITMEVVTIALKTFIVCLAAYSFARVRFKGKEFLFLLLLSTIMIPGDVTLIPRYLVYKMLHITDTMWAMVLPYTFDVFFVFLLRQFFMTIPMSLSESAVIDGCSHFKIFSRIIIPLSRPAIVTMILFTFVWSWNDFVTPYIFITNGKKQMLSVGLQMFQVVFVTNYSMQMAAATLVLVPVLVVFVFLQRYFVEGIVTTGIKG